MTVRGALTVLGDVVSVHDIGILTFALLYVDERLAYGLHPDSGGQSLSRSCRDRASPDSRNRTTRLCTAWPPLGVSRDIPDACRSGRDRTAQSRTEGQSGVLDLGHWPYHGDLESTREQKTKRDLGDSSGVLKPGHLSCPESDMTLRLPMCDCQSYGAYCCKTKSLTDRFPVT